MGTFLINMNQAFDQDFLKNKKIDKSKITVQN